MFSRVWEDAWWALHALISLSSFCDVAANPQPSFRGLFYFLPSMITTGTAVTCQGTPAWTIMICFQLVVRSVCAKQTPRGESLSSRSPFSLGIKCVVFRQPDLGALEHVGGRRGPVSWGGGQRRWILEVKRGRTGRGKGDGMNSRGGSGRHGCWEGWCQVHRQAAGPRRAWSDSMICVVHVLQAERKVRRGSGGYLSH